MRYLVIGHPDDLCAQRVAHALRERSQQVLTGSDAILDRVHFTWVLTTQQSSSTLTFSPSETIADETLDGAFVRDAAGLQKSDGWTTNDWQYVQAEAHAALIPWLSNLRCNVVNRLTADLWLRPRRPYPEWRTLFRQSGLPTLSAQITNNFRSARDFSKSCGSVAYTPLTSDRRYSISTDEDWNELAKLVKIFPICLIESGDEPYDLAWLVGPDIIWSAQAKIDQRTRIAFERGILELAHRLRLSTFEVEVISTRSGPCCSGINLYPRLEQYDAASQSQIVCGILSLLGVEV
jgi:hypothetical protein